MHIFIYGNNECGKGATQFDFSDRPDIEEIEKIVYHAWESPSHPAVQFTTISLKCKLTG